MLTLAAMSRLLGTPESFAESLNPLMAKMQPQTLDLFAVTESGDIFLGLGQ